MSEEKTTFFEQVDNSLNAIQSCNSDKEILRAIALQLVHLRLDIKSLHGTIEALRFHPENGQVSADE